MVGGGSEVVEEAEVELRDSTIWVEVLACFRHFACCLLLGGIAGQGTEEVNDGIGTANLICCSKYTEGWFTT